MNRRVTYPFYSCLAPHLKAYLEFKQKLGYSSFSRTTLAKDLDYYLTFHGVASIHDIDERIIANWMHAIPQHSSTTKNNKLRYAKKIFDYLVRTRIVRSNPTLRIPPLRIRAYKPYIYSLKEIHQILEEAGKYKYRRRDNMLGPTLETMTFLIYACGLRLSEARNLKIQDIDFEENTLSLWKTKFHKERLVPFSPAVAGRLKYYLDLRQKLLPPSNPEAPFFCHAGGKYSSMIIFYHFRRLLVRCGLAKPAGRGGPRIHDLRHAFAVHRLYKWYQDGHDILNKLPLLSTYMGHVHIASTQVYLNITQALLREGDRRFQNAFEDATQSALGHAFKKI